MQVFLILFVVILLKVNGSGDYYYGPRMALNDHLLIWYQYWNEGYIKSVAVNYLCLNEGKEVQNIDLNLTNIRSISIGRLQNASQLYFIITGIDNKIPYISKISIHCQTNFSKVETVFFDEVRFPDNIFHLASTVNVHGQYAIGCTSFALLYYDLISLKSWYVDLTWPNSKNLNFYPTATDINDRFFYIVGYSTNRSDQFSEYCNYRITLSLIPIDIQNLQNNIQFDFHWMSDEAISCGLHTEPFPSVNINHHDNGRQILIGNPRNNTIYYLIIDYKSPIDLYKFSSKTRWKSFERYGYGAAIAWLNQGETIVVLDTDDRASDPRLFYYDMKNNEEINDNTIAFSIFPNNEQIFPKYFAKHFTYVVASYSSPSTLYGPGTDGNILVMPPSLPGYYSVDYYSLEYDITETTKLFFLIPNGAQCLPGSFKNSIGVWPCSTCVRFNSSNQLNNSINYTCPQCLSKEACPLEIPTEFDRLTDVKQIGIYPESPELDVFEDVLMLHLFHIQWQFQSLFLILIIILLLILIISIFISLLKFLQRFNSKRQSLINFFEHFDLIGEGTSWFCGLISIVILILAGFAAHFNHHYHNQYPIEKQTCSFNDSCDFNTEFNAKFESSLQLLSSSAKQYEDIFHLLNTQKFTLNIQLINTLIHCGRITVKYEQEIGYLPFSCYTEDGIIYHSVDLKRHDSNVKLILSTNQTIESLRIGLNGSDHSLTNNYLQKLNFSKQIQRNRSQLSENPIINLQLTKSIKLTEGLTENDNITYTGLWLPTFSYDQDQLFTELNTTRREQKTTLTIRISETAFFIKNKQKPIARRFEMIFHTILFLLVCLELISMLMLLLKLWFMPLIIFSIQKIFPSNRFISRLVEKKKNPSNLLDKINAQQIEIKDLQQQNQHMSKEIEKLIQLTNHSHLSMKQNKETLYF